MILILYSCALRPVYTPKKSWTTQKHGAQVKVCNCLRATHFIVDLCNLVIINSHVKNQAVESCNPMHNDCTVASYRKRVGRVRQQRADELLSKLLLMASGVQNLKMNMK